MKISDLLGHALDLFGEPHGKKDPGQVEYEVMDITNKAELNPAEADHEDHTEHDTMVGPLQQKLELLKRAVGVDNMYDVPDDSVDELEQILKIAGVPTASIFDAGDDEPLDS